MKRFLLVLLIGVSILSQTAFAQIGGMEFGLLGKEAPGFEARTLTKDKATLDEYREGKKAIVFFWATWCPYCRKEIVTLSKKMEDLRKKDIKLIMVNVGEQPKKVRAFLEKNKVEADVFLDQDSSIAEAYGVFGLPTFFYVNEKGIINASENILLDDYEAVLSQK